MRNLNHPTLEQLSLPHVFHALSDPARLQMVRALACGREQMCGTVTGELRKSTASHHFKVLREAGLIRQRPEGTALQTALRRDDLEARFPGLLNVVLNGGD